MAMKDWFPPTEVSEKVSSDLVELESNPEPRAPCLVAIDVSISMTGPKLDAANGGMRDFWAEIKADPLASKRVEVAVLTFGGNVTVARDFALLGSSEPPFFTAGGGTPLGEAVCKAGDLVSKRRKQYKHFGTDSFKPFVLVITDGAPTDNLAAEARAIVHGLETAEAEEDRVAFFFAAVDGADMTVLESISHRKPRPLNARDFRGMFRWLSASMRSISRSQVGDDVELPAPEWMKL